VRRDFSINVVIIVRPLISSADKENDMSQLKRPLASVILAISLLAPRAIASPGRSPGEQPAGYDLLDRLVVTVVKAAAPGGVGVKDIGQEIIRLAKELKAAHEAKRVDDLFSVRYSRLLSAVRQAVLMDPEVLYWPMYRSAMMDFVEERTGRMPEWKDVLFIVNDHGGAGVGLGFIADAVLSEVVSLHIHLETLDKRPDILKSYLDKGMKSAGADK
jgi:hypothetical protein